MGALFGPIAAPVVANSLGAALKAASGFVTIAGGSSARKGAQLEANLQRSIAVEEEADTRRANRRIFAAQEVAFAASGVDAGSGSPLDVLADSVAEAELAILRNRFTRESQATALESQGKAAQRASTISGVGSILGGAFQAFGAEA